MGAIGPPWSGLPIWAENRQKSGRKMARIGRRSRWVGTGSGRVGSDRVGLTRFAEEDDLTSGVTQAAPKRRRLAADVAGALCVG